MLESVETLLEHSLVYHQSRPAASAGDIKLLTPTLSLISTATDNISDGCRSSSIMAIVDGIIGSDEIENQQQQQQQREPNASLDGGPKDLTQSAQHLIASALALTRAINGHEGTISSAKELDAKVLDKSNAVLYSLWLGDCERIERYLQGLVVVQRSAGVIADNEKELAACEVNACQLVTVNTVKLESILFLRTAKPVV